jgi:hypothetical protein
MKYTSALITDARNKLGGDVFARNRAGLYVRVKVKPKNPKTVSQQSNRADFSALTKGFRSLTSAQIAGWNALASTGTLTDTLGNTFQPSGIQLYISCNRNAATVGGGPVVNPPLSKPAFPAIVVSIFNFFGGGSGTLTLYLEVDVISSAFAAEMVLYLAGPLSAGVSFVGASRFRCCGASNGSGYSPIVWYPQIASVFGHQPVGSRWAYKLKVIDKATGYAGPASVGFASLGS